MDREQAFGIVCEFVKSESLRKHTPGGGSLC